MAITVTAAQSGSTANGLALTVKVLTGQAGSQPGNTAVSGTITTPQLAITPAATGSWVYGALINGAVSTVFTANGSTTFSQNVSDTTNTTCYGTFRSTATTAGGTPVTIGATAPTEATTMLGIALCEIEASGTLAEDASGPAVISTKTATTVTTASFTPVASSLLVAMVSSNTQTAANMTMTVSGGSLTWTRQATGSIISGSFTLQVSSVWTAPIAPAAGVVDRVSVTTTRVAVKRASLW